MPILPSRALMGSPGAPIGNPGRIAVHRDGPPVGAPRGALLMLLSMLIGGKLERERT
jgi:hypothetical protein